MKTNLFFTYLVLLGFIAFSCTDSDMEENNMEEENEEMESVSSDPFFAYTMGNETDTLYDCFALLGPDLGTGTRSSVIKTTNPNFPDDNYMQFNHEGMLSTGEFHPSTLRVITIYNGNQPVDAVGCNEIDNVTGCQEFTITLTEVDHDEKRIVGSFDGRLSLETDIEEVVTFSGSFVAEIR